MKIGGDLLEWIGEKHIDFYFLINIYVTDSEEISLFTYRK